MADKKSKNKGKGKGKDVREVKPVSPNEQNKIFLTYKEEKIVKPEFDWFKKKGCVTGVLHMITIVPFVSWYLGYKAKVKNYERKIKKQKEDRARLITPQEFDARVLAKANIAKRRILEFLGVDRSQVESIPPVFTYGMVYDDDTIVKKDAGVIRTSDYSSSIFLFSDEQVFSYTYEFSMINDNYFEDSREFFYNDVVTIAVSHKTDVRIEEVEEYADENPDNESKKDGKSDKKGKASLPTVARTPIKKKVETVIDTDSFKLIALGCEPVKAAFKNSPEFRETINGMKQLIREKRTAKK